MKYVRVLDGKAVEVIPEYDPTFPGIPASKRFSADFLAPLIPVADEVAVDQHWDYDPETGLFSEPVGEVISEEQTPDEEMTS